MNTLEVALELKDTHGGRVSLLSMGPPFFERYLRLGMAMGADDAYLMSDRAFGGADTLATSCALAAGIRAIGGFDLVLCGEESSDGATGQVPPGIAEWLDVPQVTYATHIQTLPRKRLIRGRRELRGGYEVRGGAPAVRRLRSSLAPTSPASWTSTAGTGRWRKRPSRCGRQPVWAWTRS